MSRLHHLLMAWDARWAPRLLCCLGQLQLHLLLLAAATSALNGPRTLNCAGPVDINHVRTLSERSSGDYTLLRAAARRYLHSLLDAPVAAGCEVVSLTHTQLHTLAVNASRGARARDTWPPGGPTQPLAQRNGTCTVNGTKADIAAARAQRHNLWTQAAVVAAEPTAVRHQSVALVVTSDGPERLELHLEVWR